MNNTALIGVLAAISGRNLRRNDRAQAIAAALSMGGQNALAGYLIGQGAADRSARQQAQEEARRERERANELEQQAETARNLAQRYHNLNDDDRNTLERILGQELNQLLDACRWQDQQNQQQQNQQQRNYQQQQQVGHNNAVAA